MFQGSIQRNIKSNNGVNIHKNIQTVILRKKYPRNIQFNSQTNTQWSCLISLVPQLILLKSRLLIKENQHPN